MFLCKEFPDLNPIKVRSYPAHEVFLLMKRYFKYQSKKDKSVKADKDVIVKKAGDNWF